MNPSITSKENVLYNKKKASNDHRIVEKKKDWSSDDLSIKMIDLCNCINNICDETYVSLDEILKCSNSTLGKLFQLFLSLRDKKDHLLNENIFNDFIRKKTEGLIIKLNEINKYPMNFIQFIKQIEILAKENEVSKEYLYKKLFHERLFLNNENQSNNAFDTSLISKNVLLNEYNNDLSDLKKYFIKHSEKSEDNFNHQMSCSTFIKCICEDIKLNKIVNRLELNDIFYQSYSLLVNQGVYIPASHKIDFHGFILCLQQIARIFHFNLRVLIKNLINPKKKSNMILYLRNRSSDTLQRR